MIDWKAQLPSEEVVILCSGTAGIYEMWEPWFLQNASPMSVCLYNPPGYSESTGYRSLQTDFQAIDGVVEFLIEKKGFREEQIHIIGMSIGSGPAAWAASRYKFKTLSLLVPVGKMEDVVRRILTNQVGGRITACIDWLVTLIVRRHYQYDNVACLEASKAQRFYFYEAAKDEMMSVGGVSECKKLVQAWLKDHSPNLLSGTYNPNGGHGAGLNHLIGMQSLDNWDFAPMTKEEILEYYWPSSESNG